MARISRTGTTDSTGVASTTVTGTGGGRLKFISRNGGLWSNSKEVDDLIWYDNFTSDNLLRYMNGRVTTVYNDGIEVTITGASPYVRIRQNYLPLSQVKGKRIHFEYTVEKPSNKNIQATIYKEINGSYVATNSQYTTENTVSLEVDVGDEVTNIIFQMSLTNFSNGESLKIKEVKVYPVFSAPKHYTPIALSSSASIIQTGETATLTAELTNVLGEKLANKSVNFIEKVEHLYETINTGDNVISLTLPSKFTIEFDLEVTGTSSTSNAFLRFNSSSGQYCGKGSSSSNNITFFGTTLEQISGKTTYTIEYDNGKAVCSSPTNSVTINNLSLTSLYSLSRNGDTVLSNVKIYSYEQIGTGTTNSQGIATCNNSITGTGKGERQFIASNSSILSEIYDVWDTLFYDSDTATWQKSNVVTSFSNNIRNLELTARSSGVYAQRDSSWFIPCSNDFIVEFDWVSDGNASIYIPINGATVNMGIATNSSTWSGKHIKLYVKPSSNETDLYIDGFYQSTITNSRDFGTSEYCGFRITNNTNSTINIELSNLKIYSA